MSKIVYEIGTIVLVALLLVYEIGTIVLVALLYSIPILTAFSFIYRWPSFYQFILTIVSIIELLTLSYIIADMVSRGE